MGTGTAIFSLSNISLDMKRTQEHTPEQPERPAPFTCVVANCHFSCSTLDSFSVHIAAHVVGANTTLTKVRALLAINEEICTRLEASATNPNTTIPKWTMIEKTALKLKSLPTATIQQILSGPIPRETVAFSRCGFMDTARDSDFHPTCYGDLRRLHEILRVSTEKTIVALSPTKLNEELCRLQVECENMHIALGSYENAIMFGETCEYEEEVSALNAMRSEYEKRLAALQKTIKLAYPPNITDLMWKTISIPDPISKDQEMGAITLHSSVDSNGFGAIHGNLPVTRFTVKIEGIIDASVLYIGLSEVGPIYTASSVHLATTGGLFLDGISKNTVTYRRKPHENKSTPLEDPLVITAEVCDDGDEDMAGIVKFYVGKELIKVMAIDDFMRPLYPAIILRNVNYGASYTISFVRDECTLA